jgi:antitoxin component HigA of HigAB toxin-antitoxin module
MLALEREYKASVEFAPLLRKPSNDHELQNLITVSMDLAKIVNDDHTHVYEPLLNVIEDHIEEYENNNLVHLKDLTTPVKFLKYLMEKENLVQNDLVDIFGSQGNVSKFLTGKRKITIPQISALSKLFKVSADVFIKNK